MDYYTLLSSCLNNIQEEVTAQDETLQESYSAFIKSHIRTLCSLVKTTIAYMIEWRDAHGELVRVFLLHLMEIRATPADIQMGEDYFRPLGSYIV